MCLITGCVYGMERGRSRSDPYTSLLIQSIYTISVELNIFIKVGHTKRCSTKYSIVADGLTRTNEAGKAFAKKYEKVLEQGLPDALNLWLHNPQLDNMLPVKILLEIKQKHNIA